MRRRWLFVALSLLGVAVTATPLAASWWIWRQRPDRTLDVVALDKTVPQASYREHLGLFWLLGHQHVVRPEGGPYRLEWDYYGYRPLPNGYCQLRAMPGDLGDPDLVFVADTYGVYRDDLEPGLAVKGRHSPRIQGGLEAAEVAAMGRAYKAGATLVAEFNTFASPTEAGPRQAMERLVGVRWTGWTGRYFEDLDDPHEVPVWLREGYKRTFGTPWSADGPGYAFVHEGGKVVVLREPEDVEPRLPRVRFTAAGLREFGVEDDVAYPYWFDVVEPAKGTEVLAHHHVAPTPHGRRYFHAAGLPERFPAVLRRREGGRAAYYFAGDFSDVGDAAATYQLAGAPWFFRHLRWWPDNDPQTFYWKVYVPMVGTIIDNALAARAKRVRPPRVRVRGAH